MRKQAQPTPSQVALSRQKTATQNALGGAFLFEYTDDGAPLVEEPEIVRFMREVMGAREIYIDAVPQSTLFWSNLQNRISEMAVFQGQPTAINIKVTKSEVFVDLKAGDGVYIASLASRIYDSGIIGSGYISSSIAGADFYRSRISEEQDVRPRFTSQSYGVAEVHSSEATGELEQKLTRPSQHNLEAQNDKVLGIPDGDLDSVKFQSLLDSVKKLVDNDPSLRILFLKHALKKTSGLVDPVAEEIANEVKLMWDRRKIDHPGEPWIKNPSRFVSHVYGKWLEAGSLKLAHLQHDASLYGSYARHISERPKDDLGLERSPRGPRPKHERGIPPKNEI